MSLHAQRGRLVLLTFLDSRCHHQCPIQGRLLARVGRDLGPSVPAELIVVSANPWEDTAGSARAFIRHAGWDRPWHWLFGDVAQLRPIWRAYGVAVQRIPHDVAHEVVLYIVDAHGFERATYLFPFEPRHVAADLRELT